MTNINKVTLFYIVVFLSVLTTFISRAPQNIATSILAAFSFVLFVQNKKAFVEFYLKNKLFFLSLLLFFLTYSIINFIHFGFSAELVYALKRNRWALYSLFIIPAIANFISETKISKEKTAVIQKLTFYSFAALFLIIFTSECLKFFYNIITVQDLLTSDVYKIRASWTYNPIPFSKLSFFGVLLMVFFATKLQKKYEIAIATVLAVMMLVLTVLSKTRASWLGALIALSLIVFVLILKKKVSYAIYGILVLVTLTASFISSPYMGNRLLSSFSLNSFSNSYRVEHWSANSKLILDNLLLGVGNNQNRKESVISPYLEEKALKKFTNNKLLIYNGSHNEYLDVAAGGGVVSLFFMLVCFLMPVIKLWQTLREKFNFLALLSLGYLAFIYFTLIFDKINYTNWVTVISCWMVAYLSVTSSDLEIESEAGNT